MKRASNRPRQAAPIAAVFSLLILGACAAGDGRPALTQAQQLCREWGYDVDDPSCVRTFRRDFH